MGWRAVERGAPVPKVCDGSSVARAFSSRLQGAFSPRADVACAETHRKYKVFALSKFVRSLIRLSTITA